ncbi:MAG: signal peptidase I [Lachnospiraceae bacterium]|nr:signal peptidase I [Lachnospiraceae bacterium]
METVKKVVGVLLSVVLWAIILLTALFTFTTLATKNSRSVSRIAGFTPLVVLSDSMAPTFNAGDLIIIKECDPSKLVEGDIITFHTIIDNVYALNTHRIYSIDDSEGYRIYTTKGDNNAITDKRMILDGDVIGMYVTRVPVLGKLINFLSGATGFLLVIVVPMLLFFVYQVYHLIMVSINLKKAIAAEETTEASQKESEAAAKLAEAEAALAEAKRLKEEAEAKLAQASGAPAQNEEESDQ